MTVKRRYALAMRGITVAAAAAALIMTGAGTAQAWHIPWGHHRVHTAAALQPIGKCVADPDHIGGSTCEIAAGARADGVHVILGNYNAYPVKISAIYADVDNPAVKTTVTTRVPAHSEKQLTLPWGVANTLWVQWVDEFDGHSLGSKLYDRP